jgi:hypothetical protein
VNWLQHRVSSQWFGGKATLLGASASRPSKVPGVLSVGGERPAEVAWIVEAIVSVGRRWRSLPWHCSDAVTRGRAIAFTRQTSGRSRVRARSACSLPVSTASSRDHVWSPKQSEASDCHLTSKQSSASYRSEAMPHKAQARIARRAAHRVWNRPVPDRVLRGLRQDRCRAGLLALQESLEVLAADPNPPHADPHCRKLAASIQLRMVCGLSFSSSAISPTVRNSSTQPDALRIR